MTLKRHAPSTVTASQGHEAAYSKVVVKLGTGLLTYGGSSLNDEVMEGPGRPDFQAAGSWA